MAKIDDEPEGWVWLEGDIRRRRLDGAETFLVDGRWRVRNPNRGKVAVGPTGEFITFGSAVEACEAVDNGDFEDAPLGLLRRIEGG